jgi:hypothetical protein
VQTVLLPIIGAQTASIIDRIQYFFMLRRPLFDTASTTFSQMSIILDRLQYFKKLDNNQKANSNSIVIDMTRSHDSAAINYLAIHKNKTIY